MSRSRKEAALRERQTSAEIRAQTVLDVLAGRQTVAGAAAGLGVTRQTIYNWRAAFIEGGSARLGEGADPGHERATAAGGPPSSAAEAVALAIVHRLRALTAPSELDMATLEAIRQGAGMPVNRFCDLTGIPRRTYYSRRAAPTGGRAAPARDAIDGALAAVRTAHPEWGARRIWRELTTARGADVSLATVKRAIARRS